MYRSMLTALGSFSFLRLNSHRFMVRRVLAYRNDNGVLFTTGLYDNDVFKSVLEGRETGVFSRRGGSHSQWRLCGKDLGSRHVFRQR